MIARLESAAIFLKAAKSGPSPFPKTAPITSHRPPVVRASGNPAIKRRITASPSPPPSANRGYRTPGATGMNGGLQEITSKLRPATGPRRSPLISSTLCESSFIAALTQNSFAAKRLDLDCRYLRRGAGAHQRLRPDAGTQVQHAALRPYKHAAELYRVIPVVELCRRRHGFAEEPQSQVEHQPVGRRDLVPDPIHQAERFDRRE